MSAGYKKDAMRRRRTRKRLVATGSRREGVYNRAGEPSVTFCGKGRTVERVTDFFEIKNRNERNSFRRGMPERSRTSGTQFRKLLLYPAELQAQIFSLFILSENQPFVKGFCYFYYFLERVIFGASALLFKNYGHYGRFFSGYKIQCIFNKG